MMRMKCLSVLVLAVSLLLSGCSGNSDVTLNSDGDVITDDRETITAESCFYYNGSAIEGTMKFQVLSSSCYRNINDAGITYDDLFEAVDKVDPTTGVLTEDFTFVLVELYVENVDAVPAEDYEYSDDVTFRADVLELADLSQKMTSGNYKSYYTAYFSESGECEEHIFAYRLNQGESRTFTLGYITFTDNVEDFYLCTTSGNVNSTFVPLNLTLDE